MSLTDVIIANKAGFIPDGTNLLVNPDFSISLNTADVITTRGGESALKWIFSTVNANASGSFTISTKTLKNDNVSGDNYAILSQYLDNPERFAGKTITISAKAKSVTNTWVTRMWRETAGTTVSLITVPWTENLEKSVTITIPSDVTNADRLRVIVQTRDTLVLDWLKLEIGKQATPFVPPNKQEEKVKCGIANAELQTFKVEGENIVTDLFDNTYNNRIVEIHTKASNTSNIPPSLLADDKAAVGFEDGWIHGWLITLSIGNWSRKIYISLRSNNNYECWEKGSSGSGVWSGWRSYLPLTGGTLSSDIAVKKNAADTSRIIAENSKGKVAFIMNADGSFGIWDYESMTYLIGKDTKDVPIILGHTALHTGNSQKVTITADKNTPPSAMEGLWAY